MKNALIIYQSKTGTTKQLGQEIGFFCTKMSVKAKVISIKEYKENDLVDIDYLFLGCWTQGLVFVAQHPDKDWKLFAQSIKIPLKCKVILFTSYKVVTGSMFSKMKKHLGLQNMDIPLEIKSRNGKFKNIDIKLLDNYLNNRYYK